MWKCEVLAALASWSRGYGCASRGVYVGYYVVKYLRGATSKDDTNAADLTLNIEEMRREGDISEAEFRSIRSVLGKTQSSGPEQVTACERNVRSLSGWLASCCTSLGG